MSEVHDGQVSATAADVYDAFFVPALFAQWTDIVLDAAGVSAGDRVLDVGCGSGALARSAHARVRDGGHVVGIDPNDGMLAVARRSAPSVEWRVGVAEELPFDDAAFDRAVSQFALMFFADGASGVREMRRVVRPGGGVAVATWASLDRNPGYRALASLVERLFGTVAADAIRAPFALGDVVAVRALLADALPDPRIAEHAGVARFESLDAWLHTEIRGWTLAELIDDHDFDRLREHAEHELAAFVDGGAVALPVTAVVASGTVPA